MIIYNVTVKVDNSIAGAWLDWMKKEHIPDLMRTGLFLDYRLSKLLEQDETEGITYTVQRIEATRHCAQSAHCGTPSLFSAPALLKNRPSWAIV